MRFVRCPAFASCLGHASGLHRPVGRSADRTVHRGRLLASHDSNGEMDERELPEQLQGLRISKDGQDLIDSKTGQIVNAFGATRFDVAVHALRGEFDPPKHAENTERANNLLLGALKQFPMDYIFNVVYRLKESEDVSNTGDAIKSDVQTKLQRVCGCAVPDDACRLAERMKGKFLSVKILAQVQDADMIAAAYEELGQDSRVIMKF